MQAYSDPKRENNPHALPDVEVWDDTIAECKCPNCGEQDLPALAAADVPPMCPSCFAPLQDVVFTDRLAWWWHSCFPGCLPDSDTFGPFDTEKEALADAQSNAEDFDEDEGEEDE